MCDAGERPAAVFHKGLVATAGRNKPVNPAPGVPFECVGLMLSRPTLDDGIGRPFERFSL
jgi:hypothetical protein